jgi:hypothetical protein
MCAFFSFIVLLLYFFSFKIFAFEINCPYGCGEPYNDYSITKVGLEFKNCLKEMGFLKELDLPWFNHDYVVHSSFLADDYEKKYENEGTLQWSVEEDLTYDEDDDICDVYKFSRSRFENEKNIYNNFNFSNYNQYLKIFKYLIEDINLIYNAEKSYYSQRIKDLKMDINYLKNRTYISDMDPFYGVNNKELKKGFLEEIEDNIKDINKIENWYKQKLNVSNNYQIKIERIYEEIFDWCIKNHEWIGSYYQRGLLNFNNGNILEALEDVDSILKQSKDIKDLESKIFLLKEQSEVELGLYHDAIVTLSKAIKKDAKNKNIYFDRAQAYFELGKFDLALKDFVLSDFKVTHIKEENVSVLNFSKGLIRGIIKGGKDGAIEFIPSALASLNGLGHGLWAFAASPLECSKEMVLSCQNCIKLIKENTSVDILKELVPELKTLISD